MSGSRHRRIWQVAGTSAVAAAMLLAWTPAGARLGAQSFSSGSTGADGPLNPTCTSCTVTVNLPSTGILNYTTIDIPSSVVVVFNRNAANTPVVILASGNVTIAGIINVSGDSAIAGIPGRGGPAAFDGGLGGTGFGSSPDGTAGGGPGAGHGGVAGVGTFLGSGSGGGHGFSGTANGTAVPGGQTYGVHTLFPMVGGSGGGGGAGGPISSGPAGGGGGGAILLASSGTITMNVSFVVRGIFAQGGNGAVKGVGLAQNSFSGCGSGGAIRLVANTIVTNGALLDVRSICSTIAGGAGRIRLEAFQIQGNFGTGGVTSVSQGLPSPLLPGPATPAIRITSIGGVNVPAGAQASFFMPPDVIVSPSVPNPISVTLQASNISPGTTVRVTVVTEGIAAPTVYTSSVLTGSFASSAATANVTLPPGTSILTATATFSQ